MAKTVELILEVDDKGTAKVQKFSSVARNEAKKTASQADQAYARMSQGIGKSLDNVASKMVRFGKIAGTILAGVAFASVIKAGSDFQQSMANVQAVIDKKSLPAMGRLVEQSRELGRTTVFTASQAAEAMEKLALAGFNATEILGVMPDTLKLAAAGSLEMAEAASITANVMRSMGLAVDEFNGAANSLAFTASNSNQVISDLGSAFKFVGPVARAIGARLTEVNSALGILANVGIKGEMAGTALRRSFAVFLGELEEGEAGIGDFADQVDQLSQDGFSLADTLDEMAAAGMTASDIMEGFGQRAGPAMIALMNAGGQAIRDFEFAMKEAGNIIDDIAKTKLDTFKGELELTKSALTDIATEIFNAIVPSLRSMLRGVQDFANSFSEFIRGTNFLDGVARAARLAGIALAALAGAALVRKIQALWKAILALNLALDGTSISAFKANASLTTFSALATKSKLAIGGVVTAVGLLSFEVTRVVMEMTGMDKAVQDFFETAFTGMDEIERRGQNAVDAVERIAEGFDILGGVTFGENLVSPDDINRVRELNAKMEDFIRLGLKRQAKEAAEEIARIADKATLTTKVIAQANRIMNEHADVWEDVVQWYVDAGAKTIDLQKVIKTSLEVIKERGLAAVEAGKQQAEAEAKAREAMAQATKEMEKILSNFGYATKAMVDSFTIDFQRMVEAARDNGVPFSVVVQAMEDQIWSLVRAANRAGEAIPNALQGAVALLAEQNEAAFTMSLAEPVDEPNAIPVGVQLDQESLAAFQEDFWEFQLSTVAMNEESGLMRQELFNAEMESYKEQLSEFHDTWNAAWDNFAQAQLSAFGRMVADSIIEGKNMGKAFKQFAKNMLKQAIAMFIEWALQRAILSRSVKSTEISEGASGIGKAVGLTFANQMASMSAAPYPLNLTAPVVAAAMTAAAAAGAAAGVATGAGVGAGAVAAAGAMAEGGIVTKPVSPSVIGEAGPEAVIPLRGPRARRAMEELDIGRTFVVEVNQTFTGDNWQESGISDELAELVRDSVAEAVQFGSMISIPDETV